ncbi:MAG: CvpA family protein [Opitutales bacterium]|nr:CvpA family protein [Opitutales bacterium]MCH8540217.1 CvpA family protein [Opitutales bacterium]
MRLISHVFILLLTAFCLNGLSAEESSPPGTPEIDLLWDFESGEDESSPSEDPAEEEAAGEVRSLPESGSLEPELLLSPNRQRFGLFLFLAIAIPYFAFRTFLGSRRGWLKEVFGIAPVVLFFILLFYGNATHYLLRSISGESALEAGWFLHTLAAFALLGALVLFFFLAGKILTFVLGKSPEGGLKTSWRIGGAVCGGFIASLVLLICLTVLYTLSTFAWFFLQEDEQEPNFLTRFLLTSRQVIDQSFLGPVVQKATPIKENQYQALWDLRENLRWDQLTEKWQDTETDNGDQGKEALRSLADDQEVQRKLDQGNYVGLLFDPRVRRVLNDPQARATLRSGVKTLLEEDQKKEETTTETDKDSPEDPADED